MLKEMEYKGPRSSLIEDFNGIVRQLREDNAKLANPWGFPTTTGFFRVLGRSGTAYGLGFYCQKCGLEIRHGAEKPSGVKHCRKVDRVPTNWLKRILFFAFLRTWTPKPNWAR